jgi:hypothetical protein
MRRALVITGIVLAALALGIGAGAAWLGSRDPMQSLPRAPPEAAVSEQWNERWEGRTLVHVVLDGGAAGPVRFVVSLPDPIPARRVPLAMVLGGLRGGSQSIRQISTVAGDPGPNAFVGYDWPLPTREPSLLEIVFRLPEFRRDVLRVPGQVAAILGWASRQPWADPDRISLLGFSLGAFVVPASQRLAEERGVTVRWTLMGYGGAPLGAVVAGHPKSGPRLLRPVLGGSVNLLLRPIEPSFHLPHLRGHFLVMGAVSDRLINRAAADRLAELTPEPRTVVHVPGDHMGIGRERERLLAHVVELSRSWLLEQGAIDPPGGAAAVRDSR